ncbi:MAG: hypothetical protein K0S51_2232 [Bacillales bacterium]|jgi:hypothetical protein|nr:hypothetical protein [Bacillales bacterium]
MKYEWKKQDKIYYLPKTTPTIIDIPSFTYISIEGRGNPNNEQFGCVVEALYTLSYAIRMMPKKGFTPEGYFEYTVFPLEGVWDLDEEGRKLDFLDKDKLVYKLMIRQPEFVTEEVFEKGKELSNKKLSPELLNQATFETIEEGKCVQCMHIGSYDDEPKTFSVMENFCTENNIVRLEKTHREIYISDARKTAPEKLKTVLRFKVSK